MKWVQLSEDILVLKPKNTYLLSAVIRHAQLKGVIDVIATDEEVAIQYQERKPSELINEITQLSVPKEQDQKTEVFELPVCYELGEDLEEVLKITGLERGAFIEQHASAEYKVTYGFIPGFLYLSGLPDNLHCSRQQTPRVKLPAGSVGIGGGKTGIYSLESPGGWQIVGRTPLTLFDIDQSPPTLISHGGLVKFVPIAKDEFEKKSGNT